MRISKQISAGLGCTEALHFMTSILTEKKISQAEAEARILLLAATGLTRTQIITQSDRKLSQDEADRLITFLMRRLAGELRLCVFLISERALERFYLRFSPNVRKPQASVLISHPKLAPSHKTIQSATDFQHARPFSKAIGPIH